MTPARPLSFEERQTLSTKLARMHEAVRRNQTTRRLRAVAAVRAEHPGCDEITRVDGRYSMVRPA